MPIITKIAEQKKRKNRRSVYLDGAFAFGCNLNVVARFKLREGMSLTREHVDAVLEGEVRQECMDKAFRLLENRLHSRSELRQKLMRYEYGQALVESVLQRLEEMGYINDKRYAEAKAESAAVHKHHGPNRARLELAKKGIERETARQAVEQVYEGHDNLAMARELATRKMKSLARLEPMVAKRRLMGMLLRRGYDFETIKPVIAEVLGAIDDAAAD